VLATCKFKKRPTDERRVRRISLLLSAFPLRHRIALYLFYGLGFPKDWICAITKVDLISLRLARLCLRQRSEDR
jgi:hypothetical protein